MVSESVIIEQNKRLSKSLLWKFQRDYFNQEGVHAWEQQVPFYVTSNPYIASSYAQLAVDFIRDYATLNPESKQHTFYILELGTGSGCFSFYALKYLTEYCEKLNLHDIKFCYVMTDFTENNLKFWRQQEELAKYVAKGVLDFAIFNMEEDQEINLTMSKITLNKETLINPLTVCANYIFDTVSHDCFYVHKGKIEEALVTLKANDGDYVDGSLKSFDNLSVEYSMRPAPYRYYGDKHFDSILYRYKRSLENSHMLFPIAGLQTIRSLLKMNDKMLLLSSDKAYSSIDQLNNLPKPGISFHGSFSLMVNYHAIGEYFKCIGGNAVMQVPRKGIDSIIGLAGLKLADMPNLRLSTQRLVEEMSPSNYFTLHRRISETYNDYDVASLAAHLCFAKWDPHIFKRFIQKICSDIENTDRVTINYLAKNMEKVASNFYYMPGAHDIMLDIGIFFQYINDHNQALQYFNKSEQFFGETFNLRFNSGLSYHKSGKQEEALKQFELALVLDPNAENALEWVQYIKNELNFFDVTDDAAST